MEISSMRGVPEMGFEDMSFTNQWYMNSMDELSILPLAAAFKGHKSSSFSQHSVSFNSSMDSSYHRPSKQLKPNSGASCNGDQISMTEVIDSPTIVSFVNSNFTSPNTNSASQNSGVKPKEEEVLCSNSIDKISSDGLFSQVSFGNQDFAFKAWQEGKKTSVNNSNKLSQTQDHIMAERKRREKLSQHFIALSSLIPDLKKVDKASVLGGAIKYLKQLQERVQTLEEQTKKRTTESVVFVKKSQILDDGGGSSISENSPGDCSNDPLPEIEARVSEQDVLIKIHCEKRKGVMEKIVAEVEKQCLTVTNSSSVTFGSFSLDITIIAQMNPDFHLSPTDLVKSIRSALKSFM